VIVRNTVFRASCGPPATLPSSRLPSEEIVSLSSFITTTLPTSLLTNIIFAALTQSLDRGQPGRHCVHSKKAHVLRRLVPSGPVLTPRCLLQPPGSHTAHSHASIFTTTAASTHRPAARRTPQYRQTVTHTPQPHLPLEFRWHRAGPPVRAAVFIRQHVPGRCKGRAEAT
jgi:hypothetical protein